MEKRRELRKPGHWMNCWIWQNHVEVTERGMRRSGLGAQSATVTMRACERYSLPTCFKAVRTHGGRKEKSTHLQTYWYKGVAEKTGIV